VPQPVAEAGRHALQQSDFSVRRAQQQRPAVGRHCRAVEARFHPPRKMRFKCQARLVTLCQGKAVPSGIYSVSINAVMPENAAFFYFQSVSVAHF